MEMHATDPDLLEQRLGRPDSEGCIRIPAAMNRFLDRYGVIDAQLEADHLARLIDQGVDRLDLTPLRRSYTGRGTRPWPPELMLKIVLFEIQRGRTSPAQWYQDTKENLALQWLGRGIRPARSELRTAGS